MKTLDNIAFMFQEYHRNKGNEEPVYHPPPSVMMNGTLQIIISDGPPLPLVAKRISEPLNENRYFSWSTIIAILVFMLPLADIILTRSMDLVSHLSWVLNAALIFFIGNYFPRYNVDASIKLYIDYARRKGVDLRTYYTNK